jgi:hypothetical protein
MLQTNPQRRFSIHQVLRQPIMKGRIQHFLSRSGLQQEFAHTVIHGRPSPGDLLVQPPPAPLKPPKGPDAVPAIARGPPQPKVPSAFEAQRNHAQAQLQDQEHFQLKRAAEAEQEQIRAQALARQQRVLV